MGFKVRFIQVMSLPGNLDDRWMDTMSAIGHYENIGNPIGSSLPKVLRYHFGSGTRLCKVTWSENVLMNLREVKSW